MELIERKEGKPELMECCNTLYSIGIIQDGHWNSSTLKEGARKSLLGRVVREESERQ